ncbi:MAG TPA: hypothetical protein DEA90_16255 [Opitutae bacterium]|nr:hypothetical protein [Puniceicoccaceae bacterium]HBR95710.1 hypothetical protein [Opitutae bacterium]|tara:strand:- start:5 stop:625 length:621 start_codon:yes stop_codon:yes gene_type:complete
MSLSSSIITTGSDEVHARLRELVAAVERPLGMHWAMANGGKEIVREHFRTLALTRNSGSRSGGKRAFYSVARDSTHARADGGGAYVEITGPRGIRQRLLGGTIKAEDGGYLAIPIDPKVKGVRAAEVYDALKLQVIVNKSKGTGVMYSGLDTPKAPKPGEKVRVLYALTKEVTQAADPSVLPTDEQIAEAAAEAGTDYLNYIATRN